MNKEQLTQWIAERYSAEEEHPWACYPTYTVFRHRDNRKWFAVLMVIPQSKLGLAGDAPVEVLNVKCGPLLAGTLRAEKGIYPAYHMSKANWVTVALDGSVTDEKIEWLLELSYETTQGKKPRT